jgi:hypothetical protein
MESRQLGDDDRRGWADDASVGRHCSFLGCSSECERGETGEGKGVDGVTLPFEGRARGMETLPCTEIVGACSCGFVQSRGGWRLGKGADKWARTSTAQGEERGAATTVVASDTGLPRKSVERRGRPRGPRGNGPEGRK